MGERERDDLEELVLERVAVVHHGENVVVDLSPYLEEYAPDYLNLLESDPYYMKLAKTASGYIPAFCRIGYINSSASGCMLAICGMTMSMTALCCGRAKYLA